jgi:hypothetical protein
MIKIKRKKKKKIKITRKKIQSKNIRKSLEKLLKHNTLTGSRK